MPPPSPLRAVKHCDITLEQTDALIYSTNVLLNCSGGVGASLMEKHGVHLQSELHAKLKGSKRTFANRGEIFDFVPTGMPYQAVFHTVACDAWYETTCEVIESILRRCLDACLGRPTIRSISMSVLATGYGHLAFEDFFRLADHVLHDSRFDVIPSMIICVDDASRFNDAVRCIKVESLSLRVL